MEEDSTEESEEFHVLPAEEGHLKYILKIAMMAGTKRKEALGLMKKLIGITNEMEAYILESLNRMARPDPNPAVFNPYDKKKGRPPGGKNAPGHGAGRKRNQTAAGQRQLSFASMNGDESSNNTNNNKTTTLYLLLPTQLLLLHSKRQWQLQLQLQQQKLEKKNAIMQQSTR